MKMFVDSRVGSVDLMPHLRKLNATVVEDQYDAGDVWWYGNGPTGRVRVGVERKNLRDLFGCIRDGRLLGAQWPKLDAEFERVYLCVEGSWSVDRDGFVMEKRGDKRQRLVIGRTPLLAASIDNFLATVQEFTRMRVVRSYNAEATARLCVNLARYWDKPYGAHHAGNSVHATMVDLVLNETMGTAQRHPLVVRMLAQVSGLGVTRAKELGRLIKKPGRIGAIDRTDIETVLGPKTAAKVFQQFWSEE